MPFAYMGKILWVDLTRGEFRDEEIGEEVYQRFLSGYGLAAKVIFEKQPAGVDPLGPDNIFGVVNGLLTLTGSLFTGRWMVVGKSPLTGGWGDANCGGSFAPALKRTGYDGIFFTGQSENPVYLLIDGDKKELVDAAEYWGRDAIETEDALIEKHGKRFKAAVIGSGGENLSRISGVVTDRGRIAARSGLGAVMGSKKLKALCLAGKTKVEVHDREKMLELRNTFARKLDRDKFLDAIFFGKFMGLLGKLQKHMGAQMAMAGELFKIDLRIWGTSGLTAMCAENGDAPIKNSAGDGYDFPAFKKAVHIGDNAVKKYQQKRYKCYSCPLGCGGTCRVDDGPYPIGETHKPEYETLCALGSLLLTDDLPALFKANEMLNRAGIDSISCGVTIAWAIEAFEKGALSEADTDGLKPVWGDGETMLAMVEKIIRGEGIGKLLMNGVKVASEKTGQGSEAYAIHAGGQELPMHDPRFDAGFGMAYENEPTPGRHTIASYTYIDLMNLSTKTKQMPKRPIIHSLHERYATEDKGRTQSIVSAYTDILNGVGMCLFGAGVGGDPPLVEWINAATGWEMDFEEYLEIGRRIKTLRQAFNAREGIRPKQTRMTDRARGNPPLERGANKGITPDFDTLGDDYYTAMGWNRETGKPLPETLDHLGLNQVKTDLYPEAK